MVAQARAYPSEGEIGYGVVTSWLCTANVLAQLSGVPSTDAEELSRLLPELGARPAHVAGAHELGEQRGRLFEAVARTLLAAERPTLLVVDDAQWCDEQSLQLIHYLVRLDLARPVTVAATVRREELDEDHPLTSLVAGIEALARTVEIRLERLDRPSTATLASELAGKALDEQHADALHAETEGNPLFIVESIARRRFDRQTADRLAAVFADAFAGRWRPKRAGANVSRRASDQSVVLARQNNGRPSA